MTTGQKIRYFRIQNNTTQRQLGIAAGFSESTAEVRISQYESGTRNPKKDILSKIAEFFNIPVRIFMEPDIHNKKDLLQILFLLEEEYGFRITEREGKVSLISEKDMDKEVLSGLKKWKEIQECHENNMIDEKTYQELKFGL